MESVFAGNVATMFVVPSLTAVTVTVPSDSATVAISLSSLVHAIFSVMVSGETAAVKEVSVAPTVRDNDSLFNVTVASPVVVVPVSSSSNGISPSEYAAGSFVGSAAKTGIFIDNTMLSDSIMLARRFNFLKFILWSFWGNRVGLGKVFGMYNYSLVKKIEIPVGLW